MIRAGLRRVLVILAVVLGGAAAISALLGALAHDSVAHAVAIGYYIVGALGLLASLALGSRGPMRPDRTGGGAGDEVEVPTSVGGLVPIFTSRSVTRRSLRKATPEERKEARFGSVGLFVLGVLIVLLGAVIDPTRRVF